MWPWAHLFFGYVLVSIGSRWRLGRPPDDLSAVLVLLGTQLPDLIDKPLAWYLFVLPNGRSLAHSVFVAIPLIVVVGVACARWGRTAPGFAFAVGYLSHLVGDAYQPVLAGEYARLAFLGWPLLPPVDYPRESGLLPLLLGIEPTPDFLAQGILFGAGVLVWLADGSPGVAGVLRYWNGRRGVSD